MPAAESHREERSPGPRGRPSPCDGVGVSSPTGKEAGCGVRAGDMARTGVQGRISPYTRAMFLQQIFSTCASVRPEEASDSAIRG